MGGVRMKRRGFTLIELLVVVAIISLLVSILLPSLNRAKELARLAVCMSNQKNLALVINLYAGDYDSSVPPAVHGVNAIWSAHLYYGNWESYSAWWAEQGNTDGWTGMGILVFTEHLAGPEMLYCPSQELSVFTYEGGWENPESWLNSWHDAGYFYRIFNQASGQIQPEDVAWLRDLRLERVDTRIALSTDITSTWWTDTMAHWAHDRPRSLNVSYSDGHVENLSGPQDVYEMHLGIAPINYDRDYYVFLMFQALDELDYSTLRSEF